ncbi:MAG: GNAT family N-acetyltransferase [Acholeplasmataceae bacterium]|jgi:ribosomal-protein-alanine N-acetyltransferase
MNPHIDLSNVILKTKRIILRPFTLCDLDDFYDYASVPGVGEMAGWSHHKNKDESLRILHIFIEEKKTFAIEYQGKVIGSLGIEEYDEKLYPELDNQKGRSIGYVLSKDYWGLGLMPEAIKEVIRYCFEELKLDFLEAGYFTFNKQSARVLEKCGFKSHNELKLNRLGQEIETVKMILKNNIKL